MDGKTESEKIVLLTNIDDNVNGDNDNDIHIIFLHRIQMLVKFNGFQVFTSMMYQLSSS